MISKELKSQLSILKETNPEYIQTLKDAVTASYKAELQAIKPSSTEEEEYMNQFTDIRILTNEIKPANKGKTWYLSRYQVTLKNTQRDSPRN